MCLIFSVYPQANPGMEGLPLALPCVVAPVGALLSAPGQRNKTSQASWTTKWWENVGFHVFSWFGSPLWVGWVFVAPARTDLRTNPCLSAWQDHPRKNSSDQKPQVYCLLILNQITYRFACLETKLSTFQIKHFNKNVCWFLLWKNFLYKKQAALLLEVNKAKCLQIAHMQFWFGQDVLIPPIKQLQNPFFFHCSLLKAVESSQQSPAW